MAYYDDEFSLKKILLLAFVFFIILEGALLGICALINSNQSLRIVSKVDHGTVTYNDVDKVSSLDVDVSLKTGFINFKFRAANTVYKLIFLVIPLDVAGVVEERLSVGGEGDLLAGLLVYEGDVLCGTLGVVVGGLKVLHKVFLSEIVICYESTVEGVYLRVLGLLLGDV